jgi:aspartyl-tRNA synthetase
MLQLSILGTLRLLGANELERVTSQSLRSAGPNFLWLVDFPLFTPLDDQSGALSPTHHPFTQVHPDDEHLLFSDPLKVK